jgi:hypothetical protein
MTVADAPCVMKKKGDEVKQIKVTKADGGVGYT